MIKSIYGSITNPKTGGSKDIIMNAITSKNLSDVLIGGGIVLVGVVYLTLSTFKNGANAFEEAEYKILEELNLFTN